MTYRIPNKRYNNIRAIMDRCEYLEHLSDPTYRQAMELLAIKKWNNDKFIKPHAKMSYVHLPDCYTCPYLKKVK